MKKSSTFWLLALGLFLSSWGFVAHKALHQVAIEQMPAGLQSFFQANKDYLIAESVRPDTRRNQDKSEGPKHYLDYDAPVFGKNYLENVPIDYQAAVAKFGAKALEEEGLVPWVVWDQYQKLVKAFKNKQKDSILYYAADLGHYIADAHVPLHTTKNHDGQLTNQKGLHALWESLVVEADKKNYPKDRKIQVARIKNPQAFIFQILKESHQMLPQVLAAETEASASLPAEEKFEISSSNGRRYYTKAFIRAYADRVGKQVQDRMYQSAERVGSYWYSAWLEAGQPSLPQ